MQKNTTPDNGTPTPTYPPQTQTLTRQDKMLEANILKPIKAASHGHRQLQSPECQP